MTSKRQIVDGELYLWTRRGWRLVRDGMIRTRRGWRPMQRRRRIERPAVSASPNSPAPEPVCHPPRGAGRYDVLRDLDLDQSASVRG